MEEKEKESEEESMFGKEFWTKIIRLVLGGTLAALGYFLFNEENYSLIVNIIFMALAWVILAYDILIDAIKDIIEEHNIFSEDFLMIIASIGAFAIRAFGPEHNEFIEGVLVMFLFQIGEMFEDIADYRSHKAIKDAVGLRPTIAHRKEGDSFVDIDPKDLVIGDILTVRNGEILPADGEIIDGVGFIDMSSLTGEPVPVKAKSGETVFAGTILKDGGLTIKVTKDYENNSVSKIVRLIEEGEQSKSKVIRFVDKFAKIYTPVVVISAFLLAIIPPLFIGINDGSVWESWIYRALNLLIISCPCAIVISVPLAYFAGIGLASKYGVIVKGASVFDQLARLGYIVTDKTGTLTYGEFKVTSIHSDKLSEEEFISYVKAGEARSNHPIAKAIREYEKGEYMDSKIESYEEIAGHGIHLLYKGKNLLVGNGKLLEKNNVSYTEAAEAGTIVYLAIDNIYQGYLVCSDILRNEAEDVINSIHEKNIKVMMLTGDKEVEAKTCSDALKIDEYHANLLPEEKTEHLKEKLGKKEYSVAYMGDGINDAAAITMSDVGIAMGKKGSDLAIDNADVVLMNDNLKKLTLTLKITSLVRAHVLFNIIFSLLVKLTIMVLAIVIPEMPMIIAVLADTGLTMLLIVISMLMLQHKYKD